MTSKVPIDNNRHWAARWEADHRRALTAVLAGYAAHQSPGSAWRSKAHHPDDSPMFDGGYFIVGIELDTGTITYHYKLTHWDDFAAAPELPHAPKWDGATPADTVTRLLKVAALFAEGPFGGRTDDSGAYMRSYGERFLNRLGVEGVTPDQARSAVEFLDKHRL